MLIIFYNKFKDYFKDDLARLEILFIIMDKIIWTIIQINNYIYERKLKKMNKQPLFFRYKKNNKINKFKKLYYRFMLIELDIIYKK